MNNEILDVSTNAVDVYDDFMKLNFKEMRKSLKSGLRKALTEIRKHGVSNLKSSYRNTNKKNPKFNDTLVKGLRKTSIWENRNGAIVGKVLNTSTKESGSGSYRLPILERGSYKVGVRYAETWNGKPLKKKRKTGTMIGKYYFKKTMDEMVGYYRNTMEEGMKNAINKINNG